ncbi:MAG: hypothetical protein AB3N63_09400 [Puniceicoccaceae bacterium]
MKAVKAYEVYEEAEFDQITLLAEGIDCKVIAPKYDTPRGTRPPRYELIVEDENFENAKEIILKPEVEGFERIIKCTRCNKGDVYEYWDEENFAWFAWILIIPLIVSTFNKFAFGELYVCRDCGQKFRYKL